MKNLSKFKKTLFALTAVAAVIFGNYAFGAAMVIKGLSVATLIPTNLTFTDQEVRSLSEAIYEKVFSKPDITQFHDIETGIKAGKNIAFLGRLGMVGKLKQSCDTTAATNQFTFTEKAWAPKYIGDRFEQCWSDLLDTFFIWGTKNGYKKPDLTGTEFAMFFEDRLGDEMKEAVHRIVWFGDTAAANTSDGGHITSTTDVAYFTPLSGLWKQVFDAVTADSTRQTGDLSAGVGITTKNSQATFALQAFNDTDTTNKVATKTLQNLKFQADMRLRGDASGIIICTQSLMDQYERERSGLLLESGIVILENGLKMVTIGGIPVYSFDLWDRYIQTHMSTGTAYYLPHRAIYTTKANIRVGTEELANLAEFDPFYSQDDKVYRADFGFNLDAKLMESYMFQAAY